MPRRSILLFAAAILAMAVAVGVATWVVVAKRGQTPGAVTFTETGTGQAQVGGPFQMVDQEGRAVDQSMLEGKWSLVFFGFTYCPDYCPTTLAALAATQAELGDKAKDTQVIFVSVDPERDTPQALKDYLSSEGFPQGVIGLTGTPEQVRAAADVYRAYYKKVGDGPNYSMDHSLTIYLMGPDGRFRVPLSSTMSPRDMTRIIEANMARG